MRRRGRRRANNLIGWLRSAFHCIIIDPTHRERICRSITDYLIEVLANGYIQQSAIGCFGPTV